MRSHLVSKGKPHYQLDRQIVADLHQSLSKAPLTQLLTHSQQLSPLGKLFRHRN